MTSMTHDGPDITGGVDTHGLTHHAAVIDPLGRHLADREFPATIHGYRDLLDWMRSHGTLDAVGVEGTGAYGAELARVLTAAGVTVVDVDRPDRKTRRMRGRSDPIDAYAAATAVASGRATGVPKSRDGLVEAVRELQADRRVKGDLRHFTSFIEGQGHGTADGGWRGRSTPAEPVRAAGRAPASTTCCGGGVGRLQPPHPGVAEPGAGRRRSMAREQTETERKYEGPALPAGLEELPSVVAIRDVQPQDLEAVYYDTSDLRLLNRGITVRRRTGGSNAGWHVKLPLEADSRQEVHLPLDAGGPREVPAEFAGRLAALIRGAALLPVAHLRTHRSRSQLLDGEGRILAEVTEDQVAAQSFQPAAAPTTPSDVGHGAPVPVAEAAGGTTTRVGGWTEFEVELKRGAQALLAHADAYLTAGGLTRSPWPSKLAHALGHISTPQAGPAPPGSTGRAGSAGQVVMHGIRTQCDRLLDLDGAVRRGEEDSVHQKRITARWLRSLLKAHRRLFDNRLSTPLADQLRWLARLLGEARDQEVLADQLVNDLTAVPAAMREGALRARITEHSPAATGQPGSGRSPNSIAPGTSPCSMTWRPSRLVRRCDAGPAATPGTT